MKRFIILFAAAWLFAANANADIYHGIDIDNIYNQSDWSSKEKIKNIIDDYTLLLNYQKEFHACSENETKIFSCYDNITIKILTDLYVYSKENIKKYKQFRKSLSAVYAIQSCSNKYLWPSGNLCETNSTQDLLKVLHFYIQGLINSSKEKMLFYLPSLKNYK